jgi:hypothetical protein
MTGEPNQEEIQVLEQLRSTREPRGFQLYYHRQSIPREGATIARAVLDWVESFGPQQRAIQTMKDSLCTDACRLGGLVVKHLLGPRLARSRGAGHDMMLYINAFQTRFNNGNIVFPRRCPISAAR